MILSWNLVKKNTSIVTDMNFICCIKLLKCCLNEKSSLAWRIPFTVFFMRKKLFWYFWKGLNRKRHLTIIPKKVNNWPWFCSFPFDKKIGNSHLQYPEHASPSRIRCIFGWWKYRFDMTTIGNPDKILIIGYFRSEKGLVNTCKHI